MDFCEFVLGLLKLFLGGGYVRQYISVTKKKEFNYFSLDEQRETSRIAKGNKSVAKCLSIVLSK